MWMCGLKPGACTVAAYRGFRPIYNLPANRSLFHDSDTTDDDDEGEDPEEFTGFTGDLEDLESDEGETEEYVRLLLFLRHNL